MVKTILPLIILSLNLYSQEIQTNYFKIYNKTIYFPVTSKTKLTTNNKKINLAGYINLLSSELAKQLDANILDPSIKLEHIKIMKILDLNTQKESLTTKRITQNLIHEMQIRGFNILVKESKLKVNLDTKPVKTFFKNEDHKKQLNIIQYYIDGKSIVYNDGVVINCKLVDCNNNTVKSTAQIFIPNQIINYIRKKNMGDGWFIKN